VARPALTFRRLSGLDRSGPPPPETQAGAPLRPWTIPNAIGYVRAAGLVAFLVLALHSRHGTDTLPVVLYGVITWGDYADGIAARVTGQYSRLGTILDPVLDRAIVLAGALVCWNFDLLPRWALAVLAAREAFMLVAGQAAVRRGVELKVNWAGRWAVWPTFSAIFFALANVADLPEVLLYVGLSLTMFATAMYVRDGVRQLRAASSG